MLPTRHASKVQALLPQTYNKERPPGSLGGSKSLCRCIHSVPFLLSSLTPQDADFTALLSAVYFLREEWVNWYLPFIWSRWHQSQTKSPGALEVNSLGEKKKKVQQIALRFRTHSQQWCLSPSPSHGLQSDFLSPVSFAGHTALGSRCHYSHLTVEKGGIMAIQGPAEVTWGAERGTNPRTPLPPALLPPGVREDDCPMVQHSTRTIQAWVNQISPLNQGLRTTAKRPNAELDLPGSQVFWNFLISCQHFKSGFSALKVWQHLLALSRGQLQGSTCWRCPGSLPCGPHHTRWPDSWPCCAPLHLPAWPHGSSSMFSLA